ncbi:MAG TPA: hypothetical protein VFQ53_20845 [Kofleriaceae bacterium]|nr:hypothetical protein [Kofleriaceae bacterium]
MKLFVIACLVLAASSAHANPRPLPFSYPYETLLADKLEIEQYVDLVPVRVARENPDGTLEGVWALRSELQTEIEYGLTDKIEVGWYFAFEQGASDGTPFLKFSGVKQRARMRFAEAGEWPVDVGVYLELAESYDELEVEEKLLVSRRFGDFNATVNLWIEQEYYWQTGDTKYIYNPTAGVSYEVSPKLIVGVEYWGRGRFDDATDATDMTGETEAPPGARHYLGPTVLAQSGHVFLSFGAYARLDKLGSGIAPGDAFGKLWFRTVLGIEL